eukprot:7119644-Alexandrium_andersonii.AAC.1
MAVHTAMWLQTLGHYSKHAGPFMCVVNSALHGLRSHCINTAETVRAWVRAFDGGMRARRAAIVEVSRQVRFGQL